MEHLASSILAASLCKGAQFHGDAVITSVAAAMVLIGRKGAVPKVAFVIFDSNPEYGHAQGLYCSGLAAELQGQDLKFGCEIAYRMRYPDEAERAIKGRRPVDFTGPSSPRMYRALVTEYSILHPHKHPEHGPLVDFRVSIPFHSKNVGI